MWRCNRQMMSALNTEIVHAPDVRCRAVPHERQAGRDSMALDPVQIIVDASTRAFEERLAFRPQPADVLVAAFGGHAAQLVKIGVVEEQRGYGHGVVQRLCRFDIDADPGGA